jgi:hypothetical protein
MPETPSGAVGDRVAAAPRQGAGDADVVRDGSPSPPAEGSSAGAGNDSRWCARLAGELSAAAGLDGDLLTSRLQAELLRLARDIAHATERRNAPVAAFVLGRYVQARVGQGIATEVAVREAAETVAGLLPADPDATP